MDRPDCARSWGAALLCLGLLAGCATRRPPPPASDPAPSARIESRTAVRPDQFRVELPFLLVVDNPGRQAVQILSVDYVLYLHGAEAGRGSLRERSRLGAGGSYSAPLEVDLDTRTLGGGIAGDGGPEAADWLLAVEVRLDTGSPAPVELRPSAEGAFVLVREPRLRIRSVAIERDLLVTTRLRLDLEIDNPNAFAVDLGELSYDFYGEGTIWSDGRSDEASSIPARGSATRSLSFTMNFANTDRRLFDLVASLRTVRYRLRGRAVIATGLDFLPSFTASFDEEGSCSVQR